jgi:hypothetical protein
MDPIPILPVLAEKAHPLDHQPLKVNRAFG